MSEYITKYKMNLMKLARKLKAKNKLEMPNFMNFLRNRADRVITGSPDHMPVKKK